MFRRPIFSLFAVCSLLFTPTFAAAANVGIIKGNLWYSKSPFYVGETITLYSAIWNGETGKVSGHVSFSVNDVVIGKVPFSIGPGELSNVATKWVATTGASHIKAAITDATMLQNGHEVSITIENKETGTEDVTVTPDPAKALALAQQAVAAAQAAASASASSGGSVSGVGANTVYVGTPLAQAISPATDALPGALATPLDATAQVFDALASSSRGSLAATQQTLAQKLAANARLAQAEAALAKARVNPSPARGEGEGGVGAAWSQVKNYLTNSLAATGGLKDPWTYAKYLGIGFLLFFVSRPVWLAIILLIIALYVLWKIVKKIRNRNRYNFD